MWLSLLCFAGLALAGDYERGFRELKEAIKGKTLTWTPGLNPFFNGMSDDEMTVLLGHRKMNVTKPPALSVTHKSRVELPRSFDARKRWPHCKLIGQIRDQSNCGSCWAVSAAAAMSDRHCIMSDGFEFPYISAEDLMTCCSACGYGCNGGDEEVAFLYWIRFGLVSGGDYGSKLGCQPYSIYPCHRNCNPRTAKTPACRRDCIPQYRKSRILMHDELSMMTELYEHGSIVTAFAVYSDFKYYRGGVYQHVHGNQTGYHAVKIIGWGEENGLPYWLVANSWNVTWGIDGFFKFLRGKNECGFEENAVSGIPMPYEENFK